MTSQDFKAAALQWLRFERQYKIVCTEAGTFGFADVLAMNEKAIIEIEVKISKADLNREFSHKAAKHAYYKTVEGGKAPNYFYFMVPEHLADAAVGLCLLHNPKYGVISMPEGGTYQQLSVVRKAAKLHTLPPRPKQVDIATARMSSELASLYALTRDLQVGFINKFHSGISEVVAAAIKAAGTSVREDDARNTSATVDEILEAVTCSET